jgi:(1->4)-alpha-D-glucan 1-alpha-D-glucosylmutase
MIYQTIVGAWPWAQEDHAGFSDRVKEYLAKALSEGKVNVSWINPRPEYTEAVQNFAAKLLKPGKRGTPSKFLRKLEEFLAPVRVHGAVNSLAQMVLKATSPGVPDFYQGTDMWDLSLVDPDNRRPVDYARRAQVLESFAGKPLESVAHDVLSTLEDGRIKLFTMHRALAARNEHSETFATGAYTPLEVSNSEHAFAYLRGEDILIVIPRFTFTLTGGKATPALGEAWGEQAVVLPGAKKSSWLNVFTGKTVHARSEALLLSEILAEFPVAILTRVA